jgi:broad specificity phosphatase PhoE
MASTPLTPAGLRQAEAVAASLETAPGRFIVSPYVRAQQTSRPARAKFPGAPLEEWPVQEFTFLPASAYHGTTLAERQPAEDAYWQANDPRVVLGDGAESFDAFFARVADARARLEALECDSVIVFSHKKVVTALLWCWLSGLPSSGAARMSHFRNFDRAAQLRVRGGEARGRSRVARAGAHAAAGGAGRLTPGRAPPHGESDSGTAPPGASVAAGFATGFMNGRQTRHTRPKLASAVSVSG